MKLLTLNCHSWQENHQLEKIKILAQTIQERSYDVIALQEVSQSITSENVNERIKKDNFALVLLTELKKLGETDYQYFWDFSHVGFDVYEEGVAILTKHPIVNTHSFFVTHSDDQTFWKTRKIIGVTINYNEPISFYSCHLGWWNDEEEPFKDQVDALIQTAQQNEKYFLMGDFNNDANTRGEGYDYLIDNGLYDTYHLAKEKDDGLTVEGKICGWDDNKKALRIDLIFSNFPVEVSKSNVIFNAVNKPIISDHFGLEVDLRL